MKVRTVIILAGAAALAWHYGTAHAATAQQKHSAAADAAKAAITTVQGADRYGPCLPKLHATTPRYNDADFTQKHAPATVSYTVPARGRIHAPLVFAVIPRPDGGLYTMPADAFSTEILDSVGC